MIEAMIIAAALMGIVCLFAHVVFWWVDFSIKKNISGLWCAAPGLILGWLIFVFVVMLALNSDNKNTNGLIVPKSTQKHGETL